MIRVFLVDDHAVLRQGLRLLIDAQRNMQVVGESEHGRGVADLIGRAGGADVVVLDVSLPDSTGPAVAAEVSQAMPAVRIVALTRHGEKAYVQQMLQSGVAGYVLKQTAADVLIAAIENVAEGRVFLDPAVACKVVDKGTRPLRGSPSGTLSEREREVLTLVALGHTNKEIATLLGITVKTVETHKMNAMQKLEITSRADLVRFAMTQGWLESSGSND